VSQPHLTLCSNFHRTGPGQPIDPKKDIPTVPVAMTGATMSPTGSGPTTSNQNPNMTQVNPNAAAANMNATREELEAKVNAKVSSIQTTVGPC
jgi:hypothetical protein